LVDADDSVHVGIDGLPAARKVVDQCLANAIRTGRQADRLPVVEMEDVVSIRIQRIAFDRFTQSEIAEDDREWTGLMQSADVMQPGIKPQSVALKTPKQWGNALISGMQRAS
jgi:hypothetical protein